MKRFYTAVTGATAAKDDPVVFVPIPVNGDGWYTALVETQPSRDPVTLKLVAGPFKSPFIAMNKADKLSMD